MIDTVVGGSSNFTTVISIYKIIEAIFADKHLELYDRCTRKSKGFIDLKLATYCKKLEDQVVVKVERRLKALIAGRYSACSSSSTGSRS